MKLVASAFCCRQDTLCFPAVTLQLGQFTTVKRSSSVISWGMVGGARGGYEGSFPSFLSNSCSPYLPFSPSYTPPPPVRIIAIFTYRIHNI